MAASESRTPTFDSIELQELKQKLVDGCHILDREGITDGFGHVSIRIPGAKAFLTLAGVSPGCATPDRLVLLDLDGNFLGEIGRASCRERVEILVGIVSLIKNTIV